MAAAKDGAPKDKAAPKKRAAKKAAAKPAGELTVTKKQKAPAPATSEKPPKPAKAPAPKRAPGAPAVQKTRVVIPMDVYEAQKDAVKKPFKEHEMKWNFLGEGKGLYKRPDNGVHCFVQFKDDGVHYSIWGDDKPRVESILAIWKAILGEEGWTRATTSGEEATAQEKEAQESDALRLWRMAEPQARPGEPEFFLKKRIADWQAKKPA